MGIIIEGAIVNGVIINVFVVMDDCLRLIGITM